MQKWSRPLKGKGLLCKSLEFLRKTVCTVKAYEKISPKGDIFFDFMPFYYEHFSLLAVPMYSFGFELSILNDFSYPFETGCKNSHRTKKAIKKLIIKNKLLKQSF